MMRMPAVIFVKLHTVGDTGSDEGRQLDLDQINNLMKTSILLYSEIIIHS